MKHETTQAKPQGNGGGVHPPGGWRIVAIGELCVPRTEIRDPRQEPEVPFRYVDISSVDNQRKVITEARQLPGKDAPSRARQVIRTNDVLVATTRPNLNAVALVPRELDSAICSTGFCVLRSNGAVAPEFLLAFVQADQFVRALGETVKGALYPAVTDGQVRAQTIPLPPLPEQRRIAARLHEQLAAVAQARAAVQAQLAAARTLPAAHLRAVFNGPAAQGWPRKKLSQLCAIVASQVDPRLPEYGCLPHVSGENIESGLCRLVNIRTATEDGMISGKYLFEAGDVLYSKLRPYLRKVAVAGFRGLCSADMYPLRVNGSLLDARFAAWMLLADEFTKYAVAGSQRSRMPKLNREQLFGWEAPTPPLSEQREIAARIEAEVATARSLADHLAERLTALDHLPAGLLREAFGGRL